MDDKKRVLMYVQFLGILMILVYGCIYIASCYYDTIKVYDNLSLLIWGEMGALLFGGPCAYRIFINWRANN